MIKMRKRDHSCLSTGYILAIPITYPVQYQHQDYGPCSIISTFIELQNFQHIRYEKLERTCIMNSFNQNFVVQKSKMHGSSYSRIYGSIKKTNTDYGKVRELWNKLLKDFGLHFSKFPPHPFLYPITSHICTYSFPSLQS